ncbi:N-lysine methyltransferase KMT5A-A [Cimex lectularius]|uniref:[histone H4]-lysine(20) N-methyltransferase n=1 Tax=Cimex lectularius TaxID=79782 RepID=A0A8I6RG68_CIMLE|nr:N-lysine methyltransferase KMT5A-A [Cimex lectularius]XP_014244327.1 N-lysine methyltransferase KMT5A-A [Cimex lectularius]XP_014244328.1 N-lysine methyltransferase KMT5A-A [Cimex lectularius]
MARGRRTKAAPCTRNGENRLKRRNLKTEFQGKLSHTSPNGKITSYFEGGEKEAELSLLRLSPRKHASTASILQQTNGFITTSPHRIEIKTEALPEEKLERAQTNVDKPPLVECKTGKLTDYFPVRRSERKTKKTVLEERQKNIEEAVLSKREDGLEVHMFPGKGRGIVAKRNFLRGDFVVEYAGELISLEEAKIREAIYSQDQNTGCYMYYFMYKNTQFCVDATIESSRLGRLVNHSRNGNLVTKTIYVGGKPRLVLIAKEDIKVGDELTYDYGDRSKESLKYHPWLAL